MLSGFHTSNSYANLAPATFASVATFGSGDERFIQLDQSIQYQQLVFHLFRHYSTISCNVDHAEIWNFGFTNIAQQVSLSGGTTIQKEGSWK
jgi:hypothetical protein